MIDRIGKVVRLQAQALVDAVRLAVRGLCQAQKVGRVELNTILVRENVQYYAILRIFDSIA
jgi:hypothetical protein